MTRPDISPEELIRAVAGVDPADRDGRFKVLNVPPISLRWNAQEVSLPVGSIIRAMDYGPRQLNIWVRHFGLKLLRLGPNVAPVPAPTSPAATQPEPSSVETGDLRCHKCGRVFDRAVTLRRHARWCGGGQRRKDGR